MEGQLAFKLSHRPVGLSGGRQPAMQPGLWEVGWWREGMEVRPAGWECGCCNSVLQSGDVNSNKSCHFLSALYVASRPCFLTYPHLI